MVDDVQSTPASHLGKEDKLESKEGLVDSTQRLPLREPSLSHTGVSYNRTCLANVTPIIVDEAKL